MTAPAPKLETPQPHPDPVRVLLADRPGHARDAIATLIGELDGIELVGEVDTPAAVPVAVRCRRPDVLVVDDRLIVGHTHPFATSGPLPHHVRLIVIGLDDDPTFAARAARLGAEAWVPKDLADDALRSALR